jgi:hypothetical protein
MRSATDHEIWVFRIVVEAQKILLSLEAGMPEAAEAAFKNFREIYFGDPQHLRLLITSEGYLEASPQLQNPFSGIADMVKHWRY